MRIDWLAEGVLGLVGIGHLTYWVRRWLRHRVMRRAFKRQVTIMASQVTEEEIRAMRAYFQSVD